MIVNGFPQTFRTVTGFFPSIQMGAYCTGIWMRTSRQWRRRFCCSRLRCPGVTPSDGGTAARSWRSPPLGLDSWIEQTNTRAWQGRPTSESRLRSTSTVVLRSERRTQLETCSYYILVRPSPRMNTTAVPISVTDQPRRTGNVESQVEPYGQGQRRSHPRQQMWPPAMTRSLLATSPARAVPYVTAAVAPVEATRRAVASVSFWVVGTEEGN